MDIKKLIKALPTGMAQEIEGMGEVDIRRRILTSTANVQEVRRAMEKDEALAEAKERAKELAAPYRDSLKSQDAIIRYCHHVLDSRGQPVPGDVAE
jgi:hypothetical protein